MYFSKRLNFSLVTALHAPGQILIVHIAQGLANSFVIWLLCSVISMRRLAQVMYLDFQPQHATFH